jgi:nucleoside-diphosphate-sugar epimerase
MPTTDSPAPVILVTGAAGFIGTKIMNDLARDHRVVGLDIKEPKKLAANADWLECDLTSDEGTRNALQQVQQRFGPRLASVVHLAAYYDFSGEPSPMYDRLTVQGTRRLIDGLKRFERVDEFIFSSSLLVMKPVKDDDERLTESSATRAEWDYPQSKLAAEKVLQKHHGDIPAVILRIAGVYDDSCHSLPIAQQIRRIYEKTKESYVFPGDADHGQPFIHLDDVAACVRRAIEARAELADWELFLIAEPDVMSYRELQDALGRLIHGKEWPTMWIPKAVAKAGAKAQEKLTDADPFIKPWMIDLADDHYPVNMRRARERLGWTPIHRLHDELPAIIEKLQRDPRKWFEANDLPVPAESAVSGKT